MNPVAITGLLVAAIRAEESNREDALFVDPYADALAGDGGRAVLARYRAAGGSVPIIEVRTRWFDEAIERAWRAGARQFVLLAAGMDARAYRLAWPPGTRVFELDQPDVLAAKTAALASVTPRCERVVVGTDLAGRWFDALASSGFSRDRPTAWLVEGVLQYLGSDAVNGLFAQLDALSAPGSVALYDVVGQALLDAPVLAPVLAMMRELGAPWVFGSDDPGALLPGWDAQITDAAVQGNAWKRWPFPAAPSHVRGVPRGHLVEAVKR